MLYASVYTYPAIARGTITDLVDLGKGSISGYITEYNGEKLMLVYCLSDKEQTVEVPKDKVNFSGIAAQLCTQDCDSEGNAPQATLNGSTLTMPAGSFVVLK